MMKLPHWCSLFCLLSLLIAACGSAATPTATPVPPTQTPKTDCLESDAFEVYKDPDGRYCLLYPSTFKVRQEAPGQVSFDGPALDESLEPVFASLTIMDEGPAAGRAMTEIMGDYWIICNRPASKCLHQTLTLGGEPAELVESLFGENPVGSRQVFVVHADTVYHLSLFPVDINFPQAMPDVELVWQTLLNSFVFFR
jgi:hypothetical protein